MSITRIYSSQAEAMADAANFETMGHLLDWYGRIEPGTLSAIGTFRPSTDEYEGAGVHRRLEISLHRCPLGPEWERQIIVHFLGPDDETTAKWFVHNEKRWHHLFSHGDELLLADLTKGEGWKLD